MLEKEQSLRETLTKADELLIVADELLALSVVSLIVFLLWLLFTLF